MGFRRSKWRRKSGAKLAVLSLALALPLDTFASSTAGGQLPALAAAQPSGQANTQGAAANKNSLASTLGKAAGVLSMAAGGLYMAKGAMQMKCCVQGCTGAGSASKDEANKIKDGASKDADKLKRQPVDYFHLRFPDQANSCPRLPAFSLLELFRPVKADATLGGCLDAGIALATGGLMLLNGMMGLAAANQAGQNADTGNANMAGMNSLGDAGSTSPTPDGINPANLGNTGASMNTVKLDPALLHTGTANDIMGQFEKQFGIPRDQFANSVMGGQDPRTLLNSAPQNPLSNDDMNKAIAGAKAMSDAEKAAALANSPMGNVQRELASKMEGDYEVKLAGSASSNLSAFGKKKDVELDPLDVGGSEAAAAMGVSPEVQAALAAKEAAANRKDPNEMTLFEVVHAKLREKSKMIFGFDPDGMKGNGNGI